MKNIPDIFSIDFACFQNSPFETVILCTCITVTGTFFQINQQTCTGETFSLLKWQACSLQLWQKWFNFQIKRRKFLTRVVSLHLCSVNFSLFGRNSISLFKTLQISEINSIPLAGAASKACWVRRLILKTPKILCVFA